MDYLERVYKLYEAMRILILSKIIAKIMVGIRNHKYYQAQSSVKTLPQLV